MKNANEVGGGGGYGVQLQPGEDIKNSIIRDNEYVGLQVSLSGTASTSTDVDNVLLTGNGFNVVNTSTTKPSIQRSELQDPISCNVSADLSTCATVTARLNFTNSTTPSFVDDAILP